MTVEVLDGPPPETIPDPCYFYAIFEIQRSLSPRYEPRARLLEAYGFERILTRAEEAELMDYWLSKFTPSPVTFTVEFL